MPNHAAPRIRTRRVLGGALVTAVAVAGASTTVASAHAGSSSHRSSAHAGHATAKRAVTSARSDSTTTSHDGSFVDAVASVVPGTSKVLQDGSIPVIGGPTDAPRSMHFTSLGFTPQGASGDAGIHLWVHGPSITMAPACGTAYPHWQHCETTTLPDGSRMRTADANGGAMTLAERTVGGIVETAIAYPVLGDSRAVLSPDQLAQALEATSVPTS
jgi:hypothetical protein